ncbi:TPA: hypothetical protein ACPZR0_002948 [Yersinia enterocolitica]
MALQLFTISASVVSPVAMAATAGYTSVANGVIGLPSEPYILKVGETPEMIAKYLGLTISQLQMFNQFRTFHKPFAQLSEGDEIDVPVKSALKA